MFVCVDVAVDDCLFVSSTVVPHISDAIQEWIERVAHQSVDGQDGEPDVCIIEVSKCIIEI